MPTRERRNVILAAGFDYHFSKADYGSLCTNRVHVLQAKLPADYEMSVQILDVANGVIRVAHCNRHTRPLRFVTQQRFRPVTKANYEETKNEKGEVTYKFKDNQRDIISVLDIYSAIQTIGQTEPGTLVEFSVFSHATLNGPVLVNSYEDTWTVVTLFDRDFRVPKFTQLRDSDDLDFRTKDFSWLNMSGDNATLFRAAFHKDGHCWLWGCANDKSLHRIFTSMERDPKYRAMGGTPDDAVLSLNGLSDGDRKVLRKGGASEVSDEGPVKVSFGVLKAIARDALRGSYAYELSRVAGVVTYAALAGTYADYDCTAEDYAKRRCRIPFPLMSIKPIYRKHCEFFRHYLNVGGDPELRRYGAYHYDE